MFQERIKEGLPINLREFLYPLLQGYDSVAMDVDLEVGGTDQTFNMLTGRTLLQAMKGKEKFVMTLPLLSDSKGVKIGKSEGNAIGLTDSPDDLFGKIMSLGDDAIIPMFNLLTDIPVEEINKFDIKKDAMDLKKRVASIIVETLNNKDKADEARKNFENTFSKGDFPENAKVIKSSKDEKISDVLLKEGIVDSKSEYGRLVDAGAVLQISDLENKKISNIHEFVGEGERKIKIGKKIFVVVVGN
jgi:tyrosyl-tRNA synthetase